MDQIPATLRDPVADTTHACGLVEAAWLPGGVHVEVEFDRERAPLLKTGHAVELLLDVAKQTMVGHGRVHGREDHDEVVRYRLALDREGILQLGAVLNRRESVRVRPGDDDVIYVRLDWSDGRRSLLPVHDLSGTGLSVLVEDELESRLLDVYELRFLLHLDGVEPFVVEGRIRSRVIAGSQVSLGIEFDEERTPYFGKAQDQIFRWVADRLQRQILLQNRAG